MSQEQLEQALAWAREQVRDFEERERRIRQHDEEEGCYTHISTFDRMCHWDVTFYGIELAMRKRRALNEDRLTLLKEPRKVRRELDYDRERFPDQHEIVIEEQLNERGDYSLVYRRYSRGVRPSGKLWEKRQAERLECRLRAWRQASER